MATRFADKLSKALPGLEDTIYQYGGHGYPRVQKVRQDLLDSIPAICPERALLITESYKQTEGEPYVLRKAKALDAILSNMSITIEDGQLIVGNQASSQRAAPIFPEYSIDWVINELDKFEVRTGDVFAISEDTKAKLRGIHAYWKGKTHQDDVYAGMSAINMQAQKQNVIHRGGISMSGDGHIIPHHEKILAKGYRGIQRDAQEALKKRGLAQDQIDFYNAVIIVMEAAIKFARRYSKLASEMAAKEPDPKRKAELETIAKINARIMKGRAQSFH